MYTLGIHLYSLAIAFFSLFHRKARTMRLGQWRTNATLRKQIDSNERYIWFHAASLGEFEQGRPVLERIRAEYPDYKILLTFFSPSGYEVKKDYDCADVVCYLPLDTPFSVNKFLSLANPVIAIFIKYEFWGNYLSELKRRDIPVYVISAIFRPGQWFFRWYGRHFLKFIHCFTHLYVQDEASRTLLAKYGITNTSVCGDTRFDRVLEVQSHAREIPLIDTFVKQQGGEKRLTLIAGSSWPSDEEVFIPYFNAHPEIRLIIAPHEIHREHLQSIESLLKRPFIRLSEANEENLADKDCVIIDSFGLLSSIYRYGELAYIGGGFISSGIHNTLEAAVYDIPVIFGPEYEKFKEACNLLEIGGGFLINNSTDFAEKMDELLADPSLITSAGKIAGEYVRGNAGTTEKIMNDLKDILRKE